MTVSPRRARARSGRHPGRLHGRHGRHHRTDTTRHRHRAGRGDHVPDHGSRPLRARRLPPAGRVGAGEAAGRPRRADRGRAARATSPRRIPRCATSACPTPPTSAPSPGQLVEHRSRAGRRRGPVRRDAGRDDRQQAEAALRDAVAAACESDPWLRDHPATVEITGGLFASAHVPISRCAAVGPGRDGAGCAGQAAELRRRALRRRHAAARQ